VRALEALKPNLDIVHSEKIGNDILTLGWPRNVIAGSNSNQGKIGPKLGFWALLLVQGNRVIEVLGPKFHGGKKGWDLGVKYLTGRLGRLDPQRFVWARRTEIILGFLGEHTGKNGGKLRGAFWVPPQTGMLLLLGEKSQIVGI